MQTRWLDALQVLRHDAALLVLAKLPVKREKVPRSRPSNQRANGGILSPAASILYA
jgi:hypothetical protein